MDWSNCPDVERIQGKVSGQWVVKDTRILAQGVIDNADEGFTAGQIATGIYEGLNVDRARRIIAFARRHAGIRILLDQNAPIGLRPLLAAYGAVTAYRLGCAEQRRSDPCGRTGRLCDHGHG